MDKIILSLRQRKIMHHLKSQTDFITGEALASEINVSSRTIRTDINEMNELLKDTGIQIVSKRSVGYLLKADDPDILSDLIKINDSFLSRTERVRYIVFKLCLSDTAVNLYDLEEEMFISSTTLDLDLQALRKQFILNYPYIRLNKRKNSVSFEKSEWKRRIILNKIFAENWDYDSTGNALYNYQYIDENILVTSMNEIKKHLTEYRVEMEDVSMVNLGLGITIAYYRIMDGHPLEESIFPSTGDKLSAHLVDDILDALEEKLSVSFSSYEREPFYLFMSCSKLLNASLLNFRTVSTYFDQDIIEFCDRYLQEIRIHFGIDFSKDEDFYITILQLLRFIKMPIRLFNELNMQEEVLRKQFLIEFEMAYLIQPLAMEYYGYHLGHLELTYIAFCISGALSYYSRTLPKINTVILCHYNLPVTWNLKHAVLEKFSDYIEVQSLLPVYSKDIDNFDQTDLILSTVNKDMTSFIPCRTLYISPCFTEKDQQNLQRLVTSTRIETLYYNHQLSLFRLLDESIWLEKENCESFFDALEKLYRTLAKTTPLDDSFFTDIIQRESILSYVYQPHIAVVYRTRPVENISLSVMTLDHRVKRNGHKIRILIMAVIPEKDSKLIFQILNELYNSDLNPENLKFLKEKSEIMAVLRDYIQ